MEQKIRFYRHSYPTIKLRVYREIRDFCTRREYEEDGEEEAEYTSWRDTTTDSVPQNGRYLIKIKKQFNTTEIFANELTAIETTKRQNSEKGQQEFGRRHKSLHRGQVPS